MTVLTPSFLQSVLFQDPRSIGKNPALTSRIGHHLDVVSMNLNARHPRCGEPPPPETLERINLFSAFNHLHLGRSQAIGAPKKLELDIRRQTRQDGAWNNTLTFNRVLTILHFDPWPATGIVYSSGGSECQNPSGLWRTATSSDQQRTAPVYTEPGCCHSSISVKFYATSFRTRNILTVSTHPSSQFLPESSNPRSESTSVPASRG